jgi:hypothetical protein
MIEESLEFPFSAKVMKETVQVVSAIEAAAERRAALKKFGLKYHCY